MVIKKLHFSFSLLTSYLLFYYVIEYDKLSSTLLSFIVASLSIIPDFDWKIYSYTNKKLILYNKNKLKKIIFYPLYTIYKILNFIFKHRTTTHSIFVPLSFSLLGYIISPIFYIISLSILLHIIADVFTKSGVPIFYPFFKKPIKVPIINTRKNILFQHILYYFTMLLWIYLVLGG